MTNEMKTAPSGEWLQAGSLLYRLTDDHHPNNCDEINITMADGSRNLVVRTHAANRLMGIIAADRALRQGDASLPVIAYLRTRPDGEPVWAEGCVCEDAIWPTDDDGGNGDVSMPMVRLVDAQAALAAKDAQIAELKAEDENSGAVLGKLSKILSGVAIALKGPEEPLTMHSWHDLAELASVLMLEVDLSRQTDGGFSEALAVMTTERDRYKTMAEGEKRLADGHYIENQRLTAEPDAAMASDKRNWLELVKTVAEVKELTAERNGLKAVMQQTLAALDKFDDGRERDSWAGWENGWGNECGEALDDAIAAMEKL